MMVPWKQLTEPKLVYDGWRKIYSVQYELPNGRVSDFEYGDQNGSRAVGTIALTSENEVIIAKQYRVGPKKIMYELPGGVVDKDEEIATAALRELEEETGYTSTRLEHLGTIYKHAWLSNTWEYFIAYNCTATSKGTNLDDTEVIDVEKISISELFENARSAKMTDTEAVFLAYDTLKSLEKA